MYNYYYENNLSCIACITTSGLIGQQICDCTVIVMLLWLMVWSPETQWRLAVSLQCALKPCSEHCIVVCLLIYFVVRGENCICIILLPANVYWYGKSWVERGYLQTCFYPTIMFGNIYFLAICFSLVKEKLKESQKMVKNYIMDSFGLKT